VLIIQAWKDSTCPRLTHGRILRCVDGLGVGGFGVQVAGQPRLFTRV
jgi:hypothetical protein